MENSELQITHAEEKWLKLLFNYCREKFSLAPLPSHDHFHHLRVWNYAKTIIESLSFQDIYYSQEEVEVLLIAILFHDIGMTITRRKEHGFESAKICKDFFTFHPSLTPPSLATILDMIEKHDEKEYIGRAGKQDRPTLSVILNISDDLDAFGNIGIYRYTEIYHFRGILLEELPDHILPNLEARFRHFTNYLEQLEPLHRKRFEITRDFFLKLENEIQKTASAEAFAIPIVRILIEFSTGSNPDIHSVWALSEKYNPGITVAKFFKDFLEEWDEGDVRF